MLFTAELARTLRLIGDTPGLGVSWPTSRRPDLRRIFMKQSGYHVYFTVDVQSHVIDVLAIWGSARGRGPAL